MKEEEKIPQAISETTLSLGGLGTIKVYHLDNGQRVIDAKDLEALFGDDLDSEGDV